MGDYEGKGLISFAPRGGRIAPESIITVIFHLKLLQAQTERKIGSFHYSSH